jgi:hypothetical protein
MAGGLIAGLGILHFGWGRGIENHRACQVAVKLDLLLVY